MPTEFLAEAPNPQGIFAQISQWAASNGFQLNGDANAGNFRGTPSGLAGMLLGEIVGSYAVSGTQVTIRVNKNLPQGEVARRLGQFGLRFIGSR
jgi:hypothetical protein